MGGNQKAQTVGKAYEIDQRAVKIFSNWLPDSWLPRKQEPDFFIDFLVETVEKGEPSGLNFAVQVKGFEDDLSNPKPLSYPFRTKHLKYYRERSQHPVFLFLINTSTKEGYWVFAQRLLTKDGISEILEKQDTLTIQFSKDDDLLNASKFRHTLPEAERFVRDLHPGSISAALQKRKAELESMDPRCSVSLSVSNGMEQIIVYPKEPITFKTSIQGPNEAAWKDFFEKGSIIRVEPGDFECADFPLFKEIVKGMGDKIEIKYGREASGSVHVISKTEPAKIIPIDGKFRIGQKFVNFEGQLPNSPLSISIDATMDNLLKAERFHISISFVPKNWVGQPIRHLAHFDQIVSFMEAFSGPTQPQLELFTDGNSIVKGTVENIDVGAGIPKYLEWFHRCRWLARYFNVNPRLPKLEKADKDGLHVLNEVYDLLQTLGSTVPQADAEVSCLGNKTLSEAEILRSDKIMIMDLPDQKFDFWGTSLILGTVRHVLTDMEIISQTQLMDGQVRTVFRGTNATKRTTSLIS